MHCRRSQVSFEVCQDSPHGIFCISLDRSISQVTPCDPAVRHAWVLVAGTSSNREQRSHLAAWLHRRTVVAGRQEQHRHRDSSCQRSLVATKGCSLEADAGVRTCAGLEGKPRG